MLSFRIPACVDSAGNCCANWPLDKVLYIFVDNDNGNDQSLGYIIDDPGTVFTPAETGPIAIKTFSRMLDILPNVGAGRMAVILFKPRADHGAYLGPDGVTEEIADWRGIDATYTYLARRGSDLTNDANDKKVAGFRTLLSGTSAAGSTTSAVNWTGGGLPTDTTYIGARLRITSGANAGATAPIYRTTAGVITPASNLSGAPANGDSLVIELPDVAFIGWKEISAIGEGNNLSSSTTFGTSQRTHPVVGFNITAQNAGGFDMGSAGPSFAPTYCGNQQSFVSVSLKICQSARRVSVLTISQTYYDEIGTQIAVGHSLRTAACSNFLGGQYTRIESIFDVTASTGTGTSFGTPDQQICTTSGYFKTGPRVLRNSSMNYPSYAKGAAIGGSLFGPSSVSSSRAVQIDGPSTSTLQQAGLTVQASLDIRNVNIENCGANPAVRIEGFAVAAKLTDVTGSSGNTDVGIDTTGAQGAEVQLVSGNTVTGTAGDVRSNDGLIQPYANFATASYRDGGDNTLQGSAKCTSFPFLKFSGQHNGAAGAVTSYAADPGVDATVGSYTADQPYPMPPRVVRNLRVKCITNTLAANMTVTVFKNGVATAIVATVTAGAVTDFTDVTNAVLFTAGDTLSIVAQSTAAGAGNVAEFFATLETR